MLHVDEDPNLGVADSFFKTSEHGDVGGVTDRVSCDSSVRKLAFFGVEPPCS